MRHISSSTIKLRSADYYPFGMVMTSRTDMTAFAKYKYGYNGKENDNEIKGNGNQEDYSLRIYDPRICRFLSVDPLTKSYPELTLYQYASNTPIQAADLDGLEAMIVVKNVIYTDYKQFYDKNGELQSVPTSQTVAEHTIKKGDPNYEQYANNKKYGETGTLTLEYHDGNKVAEDYSKSLTERSKEVGKKMEHSFADPVVHLGTSLVMPIIREASSIQSEGLHEGPAYDASNIPKWSVPYKLDDNFYLIPQEYMENMNYEDAELEGNELINSTLKVLITAIPIKVGSNSLINRLTSTAIKTPIKNATDKVLPLATMEKPNKYFKKSS